MDDWAPSEDAVRYYKMVKALRDLCSCSEYQCKICAIRRKYGPGAFLEAVMWESEEVIDEMEE
jgi:hypothetical protein